jgi:uncharacterized membrane protein YkoI
MPRSTALALAATAAFALGAGGRAGAADWQRLLDAAGYDLAQAIEKGMKEAGHGTPFHAELEDDGGRAVYSIDVAQGEKTLNVVLDAGTGAVVEKELEDEDHSKAVAASKTTLAAAIATALASGPGKAVDAHLTMRDGVARVAVKVFGEGGLKVVRIDAATGAVAGEPAAPEPPGPSEGPAYTDVFHVAPDEWTSRGTNPWFVLEPGHVLVLEGKEDDETIRLTVSVLDETKVVHGVETRVVEEREEEGGRLVEVSRNYFAMSRRTNDVYYFGEDVDVYEDGKVVRHEGAWLAGEKGARFGLMMPGTPLLGARYQQEVAPGVAMDRAEVVSLDATVETPAGTFSHCVQTAETNPLDGDRETKSYARGIGIVADAGLRLVRQSRGK